jgi:CheY-like chemotaxis protein
MPAHQLTLLLVDDKSENLFALERILEDEDYTLLQAESGHEALRMVLNHDVDLVLLDVQMPEMDGFQVAKLLRGAKKTKDLPIIFITAISKEYQYRQKGYELGASSYLMKPIEPDELKKKIAYALKLRKLGKITQNLQNES